MTLRFLVGTGGYHPQRSVNLRLHDEFKGVSGGGFPTTDSRNAQYAAGYGAQSRKKSWNGDQGLQSSDEVSN